MPKTVVYILGAGFSAPLEIPVMSNFIDKARALRRDNEKYAYFDSVISLIRNTNGAAEYFDHNSGNIEQALSLLEMRAVLDGDGPRKELTRFISDVIAGSTPPIPKFEIGKFPAKTWTDIFTKNQKWQGYTAFVASLAGLTFREGRDYQMRGLKVSRATLPTRYGIVSLNYDMVLENVCEFLKSNYWWSKDDATILNSDGQADKWPIFTKLHGSIHNGEIIPPTFNKGLYHSDLPETWRRAYDVLNKANEIRVIGYSLPESDSYIKYLIMAAVDRLKDLDRIDWIVLDPDDRVSHRVRQFIKSDKLRIAKINSESYLGSLFGYSTNKSQTEGGDSVKFIHLEEAHEEFMQNRRS